MFDRKKPLRNVRALVLANGRCPFNEWLASLGYDLQVSVDSRIARLSDGNFGDHKSLGGGLYELRIHRGPGLRVYYGILNGVVTLILGGDKSSQFRDIVRSHNIWREYENQFN